MITLQGQASKEKLTRLFNTIIKEARRDGSITRNVLQLSKADRYTPKGRADINNLLDRVRKHVASVLQKIRCKARA